VDTNLLSSISAKKFLEIPRAPGPLFFHSLDAQRGAWKKWRRASRKRIKKIRLDYEAHLFLFLESGTTFVETRFAPTIFVNVDAIAIDALAL
jgi:hypothetical protein